MPKKLKIHFSGICMYASTPPDTTGAFDRLFVITRAARTHRLTHSTASAAGIVARHRAFVYVPKEYLEPTQVTRPALSVVDVNLGDCEVFLVDNARLAMSPAATGTSIYVTTPGKDVYGWPDTNGSAPANDSRWVPDVREIFPVAPPRLAFDPRGTVPNRAVAMIAEITGASIEADVACPAAQPRTFPGTAIRERVMSADLVVTMQYPDATQTVKVTASKIDATVRLTGIGTAGLVLQWPASKDTITLRMGNDTLDEIIALRSPDRCNAPVDIDVDFDFDLHYDLLTPVTTRPLPSPTGYEGDWGGCVGIKVPTP